VIEEKVNPWETPEGRVVWKSKSQYFNWVRGGLRKLWVDYPVRKVWKGEQLRKVTPEERQAKIFHPSTKNVGQCVMCTQWMAGSKLECDHIDPSGGCKDWDELEGFLHYCTATVPEDWQLVCVPCHKIVTYAERQNIPFEEAVATKKAIAIEKEKKVLQWFEAKGIVAESNAKARRIQMVKYFMEE